MMCVVRGLVIVSLLLSACSGSAHAQAADKADAKAVDGFSAAVATAGNQRPGFEANAQTAGLCLQVTWRTAFGTAGHQKYTYDDFSWFNITFQTYRSSLRSVQVCQQENEGKCLRREWYLAGATVAKAICTPLRKQDSIVLYDAATGQKLQSSCRGFPLHASSCLTPPLTKVLRWKRDAKLLDAPRAWSEASVVCYVQR